MPSSHIAAGKSASVDQGGSERSSAALFALVWDVLTDVLGSAAVAAIVRRAAKRAAAQSPELIELVILRENLEYRYTLPHGWSHETESGSLALRVLVTEIGRLLLELTGTVVIRRLEQIPELCAAALVWRAEEAN